MFGLCCRSSPHLLKTRKRDLHNLVDIQHFKRSPFCSFNQKSIYHQLELTQIRRRKSAHKAKAKADKPLRAPARPEPCSRSCRIEHKKEGFFFLPAVRIVAWLRMASKRKKKKKGLGGCNLLLHWFPTWIEMPNIWRMPSGRGSRTGRLLHAIWAEERMQD